jgi:hypothetical protein
MLLLLTTLTSILAVRLFSGDPSPGAWLCAVDMDPADTLDLRVVGVVHSLWAPEPHSDSAQPNSEQLDVQTMEDAVVQPDSGLVAEPEGAYMSPMKTCTSSTHHKMRGWIMTTMIDSSIRRMIGKEPSEESKRNLKTPVKG